MFMGHDQCGQHYNIVKHPRKELMERLDAKHADKMYVDRPDGAYHIGYIIRGCWITVYGLEGEVFATKVGRA